MCVERLAEIQSLVRKQNKDCSVSQLDAWGIADHIKEESYELFDAIATQEPPIEVASEMGDVMYLILRMSERTGINPLDAVEIQLARNANKYNHMLTVSEGRDMYKQMGGDDKFYDVFTGVKGQTSQDVKAIKRFLVNDKDRIDVLKEDVIQQNEYGPFKNHSSKQITESIQKSANDLVEALNTDQTMFVASNMADIVYLLLRLSEKTDIDLKDAVMMKIARNAYKYNPFFTKEQGLKLYMSYGGDAIFFEHYINMLGKEQFERWHVEADS